MISNERPSPYGRGDDNYGNSWDHPSQQNSNHNPNYNSNWQPKPPVREDSLKCGEVQIERKKFVFALKENPRGRLLRITEDINGRFNSIIVPGTGLREFLKLLDEMIAASEQRPVSSKPPGLP